MSPLTFQVLEKKNTNTQAMFYPRPRRLPSLCLKLPLSLQKTKPVVSSVFAYGNLQQSIASSSVFSGGPLISDRPGFFPASKLPIFFFKSCLQLHQLLVLHVSPLQVHRSNFIPLLSFSHYKKCFLKKTFKKHFEKNF